MIIVATIPTALIGLLFEDHFEKLYTNLAGIACGLYPESVLHQLRYQTYHSRMDSEARDRKLDMWGDAIHKAITP